MRLFRAEAARRSSLDGPQAVRDWLAETLDLRPAAAAVVAELIEAQDRYSETPDVNALLVEEFPSEHESSLTYAFHAPLNRAACEALGRAFAARLGRRFGRDLALQAADLGWSIRLPEDARIEAEDLDALTTVDGLADDVPVDRWQICHFYPPSHVLIEVGVAHAGHGGYNADPKHKAASIVVDFLTPETDTTMWYFWGMARNFRPDDAALTAQIREGQGKVFAEDKGVLEAQQKNLQLNPGRRLLMLNIDAGGVQSRKIIDRMVAAEQPLKQAA